MRVFYYDYTGTHSALIAAAIHLNALPRHRQVVVQEFSRIPSYGRERINTVTGPVYVGTDQRGNQIFCFGVSTEQHVLVKAVRSLLNLFNIGAEQFVMVDTIKVCGSMAHFGAYLTYFQWSSRYGRAFLDHSLESNYMKLVKLVEDTEQFLLSQ